MKKVLVTGGCGFMFSNFIRHMLNNHKDCKITNLDALTYCGRLENTLDFKDNKNYAFIQGDICNTKLVNSIIKDVDIVVHAAAESFVDKSIDSSKEFIKTNVEGTHNLLEAARNSDIERFIHISTDEVYGSIREGSFTENSPLKPRNPYSASKAAGDMLAYSYFNTYNLPVIIVRPCNNFGPYQYPEKFMPLFITNLLEGKKVPLYGKGLNIREWLFVLDNADAIDFVMHHGKAGEAYNLGSGYEKSNIETTRLILSELGKDESSIERVKDRPGHDFRYSMDCSKIRELGWQPKFNFDSAMKQTIQWYKENEQWWKGLKK